MRQSSDFDAFEQFIRQGVEAFEEVPSDRVWEGLEGKWNQPRNGFFRGDLFWLFLGITMIMGTALWGWHAIEEMESQLPNSLLIGEKEVLVPPTIETLPVQALSLSEQDQEISSTLSPPKSKLFVPTAQPSTDSFFQEEVLPIPDSFTTVSAVEPLLQVESMLLLVDTVPFQTVKASDVSTNVSSQDPQKKKQAKKKTKKKKSKSRYRPKFGSEDWWSSPTSWKNGKSWDHQIGLSFGGDNTYRNRSLVPQYRGRSSLLDFEFRYEWVPNHRLRFSSGLGLKRTDYKQAFPVENPQNIYNTVTALGLAVDTANIQQMTNAFMGRTLFIPLDIWLFFTPPEKETQIFGGVGFQQSLWGNYRVTHQFFLLNDERLIASSNSTGIRNFFIRSYRVSAGVEQRLSKAFRLRAQGSIGFNNLFRSSRPADNIIYGGNVSLYWASPRGPLRWRKQRRKRTY